MPEQSDSKVPVVASIDQTTANANEVVVKTSALPTGASTNAAQTTTNSSLGGLTDAAASVSVDEDTTSRSMIALLKGQKNLLIDVQASLAALDLLMRTTGITYLPISSTLDSIDVAKMTKGAVTTAHSAITATATSAEIDCRGFNSLLVHWVSSATDKTWVISVTGATDSGLTFVPLLDKTTGLAASEITTDISGFFVISNIPDYVKIVATETDDGATVTCKVQPFNS